MDGLRGIRGVEPPQRRRGATTSSPCAVPSHTLQRKSSQAAARGSTHAGRQREGFEVPLQRAEGARPRLERRRAALGGEGQPALQVGLAVRAIVCGKAAIIPTIVWGPPIVSEGDRDAELPLASLKLVNVHVAEEPHHARHRRAARDRRVSERRRGACLVPGRRVLVRREGGLSGPNNFCDLVSDHRHVVLRRPARQRVAARHGRGV